MAITSASPNYSSAAAQTSDQNRQLFAQVNGAVQSGNLAAAQSAFAAFSQAGGVNSNGPLAQAIGKIGDALNAGDIGQAQQALADFKQQVQSFKAAHRHGGHRHDQDANSATASAAPAAASAATPATSAGLINVTA